MPENTSGNPNRLNSRRTWASNDGGCGRAASSVRTTADPRISVAMAGNGPLARFSARNQIASRDATTATAEPADRVHLPEPRRGAVACVDADEPPRRVAERGDREQNQDGEARPGVRPVDDMGDQGASNAPTTRPMSNPPNPKACSVNPRR